ncbi:MAG: DUF4097 domain-containing protein [Phycisphaerae bacterium]
MPKMILRATACLAWLACAGCVPGDLAVWVRQVEEQRIPTAGLTALRVRTHNGAIRLKTQPGPQAEAVVTVTKRTAALTALRARDAMQALQVHTRRENDGTLNVGWTWAGIRGEDWRAEVSFEINAPASLPSHLRTHNGAVSVEGANADVTAVTHNGRINVTATGDKLHAVTHNGAIVAVYSGPELKLATHNGRVDADLAGCGHVSGAIATHNGQVNLIVGQRTSADLTCRTHNGSIHCDAPLENKEVSQRRLTGQLGDGGDRLEVTTHNGSVRIVQAQKPPESM